MSIEKEAQAAAQDRIARIIAYAQERFAAQLEYILDDPSDLEPDDFRALRQHAADLQCDLDGMMAALGTDFEVKRLREKLAGID
jgi:hypothetical protein